MVKRKASRKRARKMTRRRTARKTASKRRVSKRKPAKKKATKKKAAKKKNAKGKSRAAKKQDKSEGVINFIIALALFVLIVVIFSLLKIQFGEGAVVARVNGQPIHGPDIDRAYNRLPPQLQQAYTPEIILEQLITEQLFLQKIKELGIKATDEEVDSEIQKFVDERGIELEDLEKALKLQGISRTEFKALLRNQILVRKLLETVYEDLEVTDAESLDYYNENAQSFVVPELVKVRHIMLGLGNFSDEELRLQAADLFENLKANDFANFCELVEQYSADIQSRENCGMYEVSEYSGLPGTFVNASLALNDGEAGITQTEFGYHILHRLSTVPEQLPSFEDLKLQIKEVLLQTKKGVAYKEYIRELRESAVVENYLVDEVIEEIEGDKEEILNEKNICLIQNVTLYGAAWDSVTQEQVQTLQESGLVVSYVECSVQGSFDEQAEECQEANIEAYPTWIINGNRYLGLQSSERIETLSGC